MLINNNLIRGECDNVCYEIYTNVNNNEIFTNEKDIIYLSLRHSTVLNMVYNMTHNIDYLIGDGVFTNKKNIKLCITTKDCLGVVVIGDNFCGIVHMGWKGLYLGIIDRMFELFNKEYINIQNLKFVILPHLHMNFMEIKNDFINLWQTKNEYTNYINNHNIIKKINDKTYFSQLNFFTIYLKDKYNIDHDQIINISVDTYTNKNFASYRRDGINSDFINKFIIYLK